MFNFKTFRLLLVFLFAVSICTTTFAQNEDLVVVNYPDFSDISGLTLSGTTQNYGNPVSSGGQDVLRLTSATYSQAGGAFLTHPISLQNNASFSTYFIFQITNSAPWGDGDGPGADGLVFVVQTESNQYGNAGGGLGYDGIDNSVGIEFDTYDNGGGDGYNGNHVGIDFNGDVNSVQRYNVGTRMNDGNVWHVWVDYDGDNEVLEVRIAQDDTRPASPQLSRNVDLVDYLEQDEAYVGFTSATGGAYGNHDIRSWYFANEFAPIDDPAVQWYYNGHYYQGVAVDDGLTWPEANEAANAMSYYDADGNYWYAHLLTVTSQEENNFIVDNFLYEIQNLYFLGGYQANMDNEPAGGWAWVTGEAWSYTNWGANEPNNQYNNEEIIHFWNPQGGWNDHTLQVVLPGFIVEWDFIESEAAPEISVSPGSLDFDDVEFRRSSELAFDIRNIGDDDLYVSDISLDGEDFSIDEEGDFVLEPDESVTVTVSFTANTLGSASGEVTISSDDEDDAEVTVALSVNVIWVSPVDLAEGLCEYVCMLKDDGILNRGQANSLCVKTRNAGRAMDRGQVRTATNVLNAFIHEVNAFVQGGVLPEANGQWLVDEANFIIDLIVDFGVDGSALQNLEENEVPSTMGIMEAYPNPFNSTTSINFNLPEASRVSLAVYDITGRQVATLIDGNLSAGLHKTALSAHNLQTGTYFIRLTAQSQTQVQKIMLVK